MVVIGVTVLIFTLGAFTLGRLTSPELEEAAPSTTEAGMATPVTSTTTTIFQPDEFRLVDVATGPPVVWARVHGVPPTFPVGLVRHRDRVILFGTERPWWGSDPSTGLEAWSSEDGIFWSGHGSVITSDHTIRTIVSTDVGLLALGTSPSDANAAIWLGEDTSSWEEVQLPDPPEMEPGEGLRLLTADATEDTLIVFGTVALYPERTVIEYLPEPIGSLALEYGFGYSGDTLEIQAPFGLTVFTATREELGIPIDLWGRLSTGGREQIYVWRSPDLGATWQVAAFEEAQWIESVKIQDDGNIDVIGHSVFGPTRWTSGDGDVWGSNVIPSNVNAATKWRDGFAAVWSGSLAADVAVSTDSVSWRPMGLAELLPTQIGWHVWPLMADEEAGIAAVVTGHRPSGPGTAPTAYVDKGQYRVSVDHNIGEIVILDTEAETVLATIPAYTSTVSELIAIDLADETLTFLHPDTSEPIFTVTLEEMRAAEEAAWSQQSSSRPLRGFFYSPDGEQWSLQDMTEWFGSDDVIQIAAVNDRLIAVTLDEFWYRGETPQSRLWMGILPDR